MRSLWCASSVPVSSFHVKQLHASHRAADKASRTTIRADTMGESVSNLFALNISSNASAHVYELEVDRDGRKIPTSPSRSWRVFSNFLKAKNVHPPIHVDGRVYSSQALPDELLALPRELLDLGWSSCRLVKRGESLLKSLQVDDLQKFVNKLLPRAASSTADIAGVRDVDGKLVCLSDSIAVDGIRVFEGTTAHALFINGPFSGTNQAQSNAISQLSPGVVPSLQFTVKTVAPAMTVSGRSLASFIVADASSQGIVLRVWDQPMIMSTLVENCTFIASGIVAQINPSNQKMELMATQMTAFHGVQSPIQVSDSSARLVVRLDTRCTVASENSLWQEVRHQFGSAPFSGDIQRQINLAAEAMPVVSATSLRHGVVKILNFNVKDYNQAPFPNDVRAIQQFLEPNQPVAILNDYSVLPLQTLHCCFDPQTKAWQDISVAACSYFPSRRESLLHKFTTALGTGLLPWGLSMSPDALRTRDISTLFAPTQRRGKDVHEQQAVVVVGVCGPRSSAKDREMTTGTAEALAKALRAARVTVVDKEADAVDDIQKFKRTCMTTVLIVSADRDGKGCRWLEAELLRSGCIVCALPPTTPKKCGLLAANFRTQISKKVTASPLSAFDISEKNPSLVGKCLLTIGIDTCHNGPVSVIAMVGILVTPNKESFVFPRFWKTTVRGQELEQVAAAFKEIIASALSKHVLDEIVVFQDGSVFSELESMKRSVPSGVGLSFLCLHKRSHIRFHHQGATIGNNVRGTVIQALTPSSRNSSSVAPSFYLQSFDSNMSTARSLHCTVHCTSVALSIQDLHQLCFSLSHAHTLTPTKLPLPARCAHKLAAKAERLIDSCPDLTWSNIPSETANRMWFL